MQCIDLLGWRKPGIRIFSKPLESLDRSAFSVSKPIKNQRVVPRYQNTQKIGGFCNLLFKSSHIGEDLDGVDASLVRFFAPKK